MPEETLDQQILSVVQQQFGSSNYSKFQAIRYVWYSKQTYGTAGATEFNFFGDVLGQNGITDEDTNMTRANSFSQRYFLMRSIRAHFYAPASTIASTTNIQSTYLGVLHDVCNSNSWLEFKIADKDYLKIRQPLMYQPFATGITNNTLNAFVGNTSAVNFYGYGNVSPRKDDAFVLEPPQLIEAETTFTMKIRYDTAVTIPTAGVIAMWIDGIVFRPLQ